DDRRDGSARGDGGGRSETESYDTAAAAESALDRMTDGFIAVDTEWRVTFVNERADELLGAANTPEPGEDFWGAYPGLRESAFGEAYRRAIETREPQTVEAYYDHLDGWFEATAYPSEDGLSIYFQDVTERRELEESLRLENELRRQVFETAPTGIVVVDADGVVRQANDRALQLLGIEESQLGTITYDDPEWETFDESGDPLDTYPVDEVLATDEPVRHYEHGFEREDGTQLWLSVSAAPLHDADGSVQRIVVVFDDHTEQRTLETRLRESEASLRRLYEVAGDPETAFEAKLREILDVGRDRLGLGLGFLTQIDGETQEMVEVVGDHEEIYVGASCPLSQAYCKRTIESDGLLAVYDALEAGWAETEPYEVFELGSYLGGKVLVEGELFGTLCFADDEPRGESFSDAERTFVELLTQWVSYELSRRQSRERIERQNERLDDFASVVSHDLRNPLNVAAARVDLAVESGDTSHLADAQDALGRMDELIDDMLSLARYGEDVVETEAVGVAAAADRAWQSLRRTDTSEATLSVADDLPTVEGDESRVVQLFEKLFGNAVDHAGPAVTVTVGRLDEAEGFYVADDGPGIPPERREQVFEQGYSTDDDGTGFGLGVVDQIADAHGWELDLVESTDGGARFEFRAATVSPFGG
ncbi:MAG: PAS domain-containing protein, partial [Halobaculum sp.]